MELTKNVVKKRPPQYFEVLSFEFRVLSCMTPAQNSKPKTHFVGSISNMFSPFSFLRIPKL
jgi:hypothetical protein